ncbi:hypothetical protein GLYMA_17G015900v4 [Glycine max]|nr:hypothetical protein GLYMA_17G015900v4 [Glycine max]KAH1116240.1 hypothetical protein GYH30_045929 [Glycine max]
MDEDEDPLATCPPDSLQALIRQSKGTGVFIPQSTQPRRKHRKGRSSSNAKYRKQSQDTRTVSQVPITSSFKPKNG